MRSDVLGCLTAMERTPEGYAATFTFGAELDVFSGHFPGYPLVPGVFLLEAVRCAAERATEGPLLIRRVEDAKFTAEVGPGDAVAVSAALTDAGLAWKCDARLASDRGAVARIRLLLEKERSGRD
jgi:3-hydroxyacyl-[acyl-carrier-protein] dehydratase